MKKTRQCGECQSSSIYTTTISSGGGYAPDLLPGTQPWYSAGKVEIYICTKCGHLQFFVPDDVLAKVSKSKKFRKHS